MRKNYLWRHHVKSPLIGQGHTWFCGTWLLCHYPLKTPQWFCGIQTHNSMLRLCQQQLRQTGEGGMSTVKPPILLLLVISFIPKSRTRTDFTGLNTRVQVQSGSLCGLTLSADSSACRRKTGSMGEYVIGLWVDKQKLISVKHWGVQWKEWCWGGSHKCKMHNIKFHPDQWICQVHDHSIVVWLNWI